MNGTQILFEKKVAGGIGIKNPMQVIFNTIICIGSITINVAFRSYTQRQFLQGLHIAFTTRGKAKLNWNTCSRGQYLHLDTIKVTAHTTLFTPTQLAFDQVAAADPYIVTYLYRQGIDDIIARSTDILQALAHQKNKLKSNGSNHVSFCNTCFCPAYPDKVWSFS